MALVWIAQCLCPERHCIMAAATTAETEREARDAVLRPLRNAINQVLAIGAMNPWCALCGAEQPKWTFELGVTAWSNLEEANKELRRAEAEQLALGAIFGDIHRGKPN